MTNKYFLIPVTFLIPVFIINTKCHTPKNRSDVIITHSNHAEADPPRTTFTETKSANTDNIRVIMPETSVNAYETTPDLMQIEEAKNDVVFIPNNKPMQRSFNNYNGHIKISDFMAQKNDNDIITDKNIKHETETSTKDTIFVTGKNAEFVEMQPTSEINVDPRRNEKGIVKKARDLNCTNLECPNAVKSVCGGKKENSRWRYRLFLNNCYFRKVNCGFKYEINRYKLVKMDNCNLLGRHNTDIPFSFAVKPLVLVNPVKVNYTRRSSSSRRSLSMGIDGQFCSHSCPISCPDDYNPECAVSNSGRRRVFVNHCKMDFNSCSYAIVWHKRPLSECVGGKKADMRENRGFIGWMQRVGIVDKKGRLVLS